MRAGIVTLQFVRIAALVGLVLATGWQAHNRQLMFARTPFIEAQIWMTWAVGCLFTVAVVAVILVGRRSRHPWTVLLVEAVPAAVLAFMLPLQWFSWFGVNRWTMALASGPVQPLAVAWFCVVVAVAFHQIRSRRRPAHPAGPGWPGTFPAGVPVAPHAAGAPGGPVPPGAAGAPFRPVDPAGPYRPE